MGKIRIENEQHFYVWVSSHHNATSSSCLCKVNFKRLCCMQFSFIFMDVSLSLMVYKNATTFSVFFKICFMLLFFAYTSVCTRYTHTINMSAKKIVNFFGAHSNLHLFSTYIFIFSLLHYYCCCFWRRICEMVISFVYFRWFSFYICDF